MITFFQVKTEDLERRVEELKKEYDYAKEKARAAIVTPVILTEVVAPPSNGLTTLAPENIGSTTPTKYAFTSLFNYKTYMINNLKWLIMFCFIENQLRRGVEVDHLQKPSLEVEAQDI